VVALLDVSVLVALLDENHIHHQLAHDWFDDHRASGWATCPLTENGLIRVATSKTFFDPPHRPADVIDRLRAFQSSGHHQFWPAALSLADQEAFDAALIRGPKQVADVYLLGLAASRGGVFATLDQSITVSAVKTATTRNLMVLSADPAAPRSAGR
jgi:toxin-antitoxin system PIN domain toxin